VPRGGDNNNLILRSFSAKVKLSAYGDMQDQLAKQFLDRMISDRLVAGVTGDGDVTFPLDQDQFRDLVEQRMDRRRMQELLDSSGGSFIDLIRKTQLKGV
jgi:parvulin-like peptidyl-prolyl isomerase